MGACTDCGDFVNELGLCLNEFCWGNQVSFDPDPKPKAKVVKPLDPPSLSEGRYIVVISAAIQIPNGAPRSSREIQRELRQTLLRVARQCQDESDLILDMNVRSLKRTRHTDQCKIGK